MKELQPTNEPPVHAVYPIVPTGPAVVILNDYSSLFRVAVQPPVREPSAPERSAPQQPT